MSLLEIRDLNISFQSRDGPVQVLHSLSLSVSKGESLAVVGETGCGKTVLARAITRLLPRSANVEGSVLWKGRDVMPLSEKEMLDLRGREIALLMQNPSSCLDPTMRVLKQVAEPLRLRLGMRKEEADDRAREVLANTGLPPERMRSYPHELSGGMRQRVALAIALSMNPSFLLADEPTKGLDDEAKASAVELLRSSLTADRTAMIITHDLEVAEAIAPRIAVMFRGRVVESGRTKDILADPQHPYTVDLVSSMPRHEFGKDRVIKPTGHDRGCCYSHRCEHVHDRCCIEPEHFIMADDRTCRCWLKEEG